MVVGGATSAEQVVQNAAAGGIALSAADRAVIEVSAPGPVEGGRHVLEECGRYKRRGRIKHSCQLPSVRARTGFAATDDAVGVAGSLFGDSNGPEPRL